MADPAWFGNETYYQQLKQDVIDGNPQAMERLLTDVNAYARPIAHQWAGREDAEDILMELDCRVLTHIVLFLQQSDNKTPFQRQAWLKTLLQRTIYDHLDREGFGEHYRTRKKREAQGQTPTSVQSTSLEAWQEQGGDIAALLGPEEEFLLREESPILNEIIQYACALQLGPAELLTFFYHNVVFYLEGTSEKKGLPTQTAQRLAGKSLGELRDALPAMLEEVSGLAVPLHLLEPLDRKLEGHREELYTFPASKISASTSYTKRRVAAQRKT